MRNLALSKDEYGSYQKSNKFKAFSNVDVGKMVSIFNQTIINILCNFIPHETVLFDDRDPPWVNKEIKQLTHEKKHNFTCFRRNNNDKQF